MASAAFLWWPPGHNLASLAPGVTAKTWGDPVTWPAAAVALPWWPRFSPAGTHHSRTDKQLGEGGGIFRENNCTNSTKHVHKTRLLIFTTRQRHRARLTSRGAGAREPHHREAHPGWEGTSGTHPVSLHLSIQAKVLQVSPQSAQRAPAAPSRHVSASGARVLGVRPRLTAVAALAAVPVVARGGWQRHVARGGCGGRSPWCRGGTGSARFGGCACGR